MISLLGLVLNTVGAFIILIPDIPKLYRVSHRLPPLKTIESGEKRLYQEGEIQPEDTGFKHISEAFFSGSPPMSDAPRLDEAESTSVMIRLDGKELESESGGFAVKRIMRNEGATISDSTYTIELYSQPALNLNNFLSNRGVAAPNPYISVESSQGAIPEYVEKYKRKVIFRAGAALLLVGFVLQGIDKVGIL